MLDSVKKNCSVIFVTKFLMNFYLCSNHLFFFSLCIFQKWPVESRSPLNVTSNYSRHILSVICVETYMKKKNSLIVTYTQQRMNIECSVWHQILLEKISFIFPIFCWFSTPSRTEPTLPVDCSNHLSINANRSEAIVTVARFDCVDFVLCLCERAQKTRHRGAGWTIQEKKITKNKSNNKQCAIIGTHSDTRGNEPTSVFFSSVKYTEIVRCAVAVFRLFTSIDRSRVCDWLVYICREVKQSIKAICRKQIKKNRNNKNNNILRPLTAFFEHHKSEQIDKSDVSSPGISIANNK